MANKRKSEQGQALAIVLMIIALTATIAGSAAFRTVNQTRQTKEQEEQQKASNAAQGIIEKVLNDESVNTTEDFGEGNIGKYNANISPVVTSAIASDEFVTAQIPKDSQYLFYLKKYNFQANTFSGAAPSLEGKLRIYFDSDNNCPLIEIIYIKDDLNSTVLARKISTNCGATNAIDGTNNRVTHTSSVKNMTYREKSATFQRYITLPASPVTGAANNVKLIIIRPLFASTKLGFMLNVGGKLPAQGELITSQAQSGGGAQSTESVTREYPQIPDFFFATSF